jgi:drug/metabolite transporter (DMT)-like permease
MSKQSLIRLAALGLIWGSVFMWIKIAGYGLSPVQMVFGRLVLGAAVLVAMGYIRGLRLPQGRQLWGHLTIAALLGNAIPWVLFAEGERAGSTGVAGVINATTPLWTVAITLLWRQRLGLARAIGLALGVGGTALIAAPWNGGELDGVPHFVIGTISLGISFAYMGRYLTGRGIPPLMLAAGQLIAASALLTVAVPFAGLQPIDLRTDSVFSLLVLGILGTGFAYVLNFRLIIDDGGTAASTVTYLLPIVAVVLGVVVLDEPLAWTVLAGMATNLAAAGLVRIRPRLPKVTTDHLVPAGDRA